MFIKKNLKNIGNVRSVLTVKGRYSFLKGPIIDIWLAGIQGHRNKRSPESLRAYLNLTAKLVNKEGFAF